MQWAIVFFVAMYLICTCHEDDERAAEEARIQQEVARRVEVERKKMAERDALLHTVSLIVLVVLGGGAVAGFLWIRRSRVAAQVVPVSRVVQDSLPGYIIQQARPQRIDYHAPRTGRVIDMRPAAPSLPVQQTLQQEQPGWIRQRRHRRRNRDPDRQPNPPRRSRENPRHP